MARSKKVEDREPTKAQRIRARQLRKIRKRKRSIRRRKPADHA